jgi:hypothetical protein
MSSNNFGHPVHGVLGVADFNGDSQADVLYLPFNWPGLADGVLTADHIDSPFEQIHTWVANSIFPDNPSGQGVLDFNRDGTSDFYLAGPSGVTFFTMGDWKDWPQPIYGPLIDSDPDTDFAVIAQGPTFGVSGMRVIGTGTFKEN